MAIPERLELAERDPHVAPLQPVPESVQVTPLFCESFCTVAVNFCVPMPACTEADVSDSDTCIGGAGVLTVAEFE